MRRLWWLCGIVALLMAANAPSAMAYDLKLEPGCIVDETDTVDEPDSALELLAVINQHRAGAHVQTLRPDPALTRAAVMMARDMARRGGGTSDHKDSYGRLIVERAAACGSPSSVYQTNLSPGGSQLAYAPWVGENQTWGGAAASEGEFTPDRPFTSWLNSPPHRANIEDPQWDITGIAIARGISKRTTFLAAEMTTTYYAVQVFGISSEPNANGVGTHDLSSGPMPTQAPAPIISAASLDGSTARYIDVSIPRVGNDWDRSQFIVEGVPVGLAAVSHVSNGDKLRIVPTINTTGTFVITGKAMNPYGLASDGSSITLTITHPVPTSGSNAGTGGGADPADPTGGTGNGDDNGTGTSGEHADLLLSATAAARVDWVRRRVCAGGTCAMKRVPRIAVTTKGRATCGGCRPAISIRRLDTRGKGVLLARTRTDATGRFTATSYVAVPKAKWNASLAWYRASWPTTAVSASHAGQSVRHLIATR